MIIETPAHAHESAGSTRRVALLVATACGAGYAPLASGSVGSALAVLLFVPLAALGPFAFALCVVGLLAVGIWAADEAERAFGRKDDGRIVIDEVIGQLLTLAPLALVPRLPQRSPTWLVTGFVAFRLLDIWKPGPVRWAERRFRGGVGVVMDDVIAGLLGALLLGAAAWTAEWVG